MRPRGKRAPVLMPHAGAGTGATCRLLLQRPYGPSCTPASRTMLKQSVAERCVRACLRACRRACTHDVRFLFTSVITSIDRYLPWQILQGLPVMSGLGCGAWPACIILRKITARHQPELARGCRCDPICDVFVLVTRVKRTTSRCLSLPAASSRTGEGSLTTTRKLLWTVQL